MIQAVGPEGLKSLGSAVVFGTGAQRPPDVGRDGHVPARGSQALNSATGMVPERLRPAVAVDGNGLVRDQLADASISAGPAASANVAQTYKERWPRHLRREQHSAARRQQHDELRQQLPVRRRQLRWPAMLLATPARACGACPRRASRSRARCWAAPSVAPSSVYRRSRSAMATAKQGGFGGYGGWGGGYGGCSTALACGAWALRWNAFPGNAMGTA